MDQLPPAATRLDVYLAVGKRPLVFIGAICTVVIAILELLPLAFTAEEQTHFLPLKRVGWTVLIVCVVLGIVFSLLEGAYQLVGRVHANDAAQLPLEQQRTIPKHVLFPKRAARRRLEANGQAVLGRLEDLAVRAQHMLSRGSVTRDEFEAWHREVTSITNRAYSRFDLAVFKRATLYPPNASPIAALDAVHWGLKRSLVLLRPEDISPDFQLPASTDPRT